MFEKEKTLKNEAFISHLATACYFFSLDGIYPDSTIGVRIEPK